MVGPAARNTAVAVSAGPEGSGAPRPVLLVGVPRSGTTWAGRVLSAAPATHEVTEPDNEGWSAPAIASKRGLGRFPVLAPGDRAPAYRRLWRWVFDGAPSNTRLQIGGRALHRLDEEARQRLVGGHRAPVGRIIGTLSRPPRPAEPRADRPAVVAKSVHSPLALEWLAAEFDVQVVVLLRHPAAIYSSWIELDLPDADRGLDRDPAVQRRLVQPLGLPQPGPGQAERSIWQLGVLLCALEDAVSRHPDWHVRTHEDLCEDPTAAFGSLYRDLGLAWTTRAEDFLAASDRPGSGFATLRPTAELPGAWESRLSGAQVDELRRVLGGFPLRRWSAAGFGRSA